MLGPLISSLGVGLIAAVWTLATVRAANRPGRSRALAALAGPAFLLMALAGAPRLWGGGAPADSLYTLGLAARAGLLLISLLLATAGFLALGGLIRAAPQPSLPWLAGRNLGAALGVWFLFIWISPQVYYLYYQMIFSDLPWQVVIRAPPSPAALLDLLRFDARPTYADHARGLLGRAFALYALFPPIHAFARCRTRPVLVVALIYAILQTALLPA